MKLIIYFYVLIGDILKKLIIDYSLKNEINL